MRTNRTKVKESTLVENISDYSLENQCCEVEFTGGTVYRYFIDLRTYTNWVLADSMGSYYNRYIKRNPNFRFEVVDDVEVEIDSLDRLAKLTASYLVAEIADKLRGE